jgi:hypothetical protein
VYVTDDVTTEYLLQLEESRGKSRQGAIKVSTDNLSPTSPKNSKSPKAINGQQTSSTSEPSDNNGDNSVDDFNAAKKRTSSCEALYNERSLYESNDKRLRVN